MQILSPSLKRTGRLTNLVCIDFRNLNDACLKDEFPLPITERILDKTFGYERMSFMDGFSGQIKMHPDDLFAHSAPLSAFTLTLYNHALRVKECRSKNSTGYDANLQRDVA